MCVTIEFADVVLVKHCSSSSSSRVTTHSAVCMHTRKLSSICYLSICCEHSKSPPKNTSRATQEMCLNPPGAHSIPLLPARAERYHTVATNKQPTKHTHQELKHACVMLLMGVKTTSNSMLSLLHYLQLHPVLLANSQQRRCVAAVQLCHTLALPGGDRLCGQTVMHERQHQRQKQQREQRREVSTNCTKML